MEGLTRDLALFNLAIDSKLRGLVRDDEMMLGIDGALSMAAIRFANRSFVKFFSRWFTALNLLPSIVTALPSSRCRSRQSGSRPCVWLGRCHGGNRRSS
jgi:hypothetical protein